MELTNTKILTFCHDDVIVPPRPLFIFSAADIGKGLVNQRPTTLWKELSRDSLFVGILQASLAVQAVHAAVP